MALAPAEVAVATLMEDIPPCMTAAARATIMDMDGAKTGYFGAPSEC